MTFVNFGLIHWLILGSLFGAILILLILKNILPKFLTKDSEAITGLDYYDLDSNYQTEVNQINLDHSNKRQIKSNLDEKQCIPKNATKTKKLTFTSQIPDFITTGLILGLVGHSFYYFYNHLTRGTFTWAKYLPLHICNLSTYLLIIALICLRLRTKHSSKIATLVYYWSLVPAALALLFPDLQSNQIGNFEFIEFFWNHWLIVFSSFYLLIFGRLVASYRLVLTAILILLTFALILIYPLNLWLGSNYMYVNRLTASGPMSLLPAPPLHLVIFTIILWVSYSGQFLLLKLVNKKLN